MLVRRAIEPGYGKWVFPGGYVDRGEEITLAAIREAREESGLDVRIDRLINIYSYAGRTPDRRRLRGDPDRRRAGGATTKGSKRSAFEPEAIPWDELAFRSTREALTRLPGRACASRSVGATRYAIVTSGVRYTS